jgi:guanylate cyclase
VFIGGEPVFKDVMEKIINLISRIGSVPSDSEEQQIQKTLMVSASLMIILPGLIWGLIYYSFGEFVAGSIPLLYCLLSFISLIYLGLTKKFNLYRFSQLILIIFLPFLLMIALGGYLNSSAVIIWSLICPFGALLFSGTRKAPYWFIVYLGLVVLSGFLQAFARPFNNIPGNVIILFFVANIGTVSAIAFFLLLYFINEKDKILHLLSLEQAKSENLLLNVLPKKIAYSLKQENATIAEHFENTSILFADIVGFTPMSANMEPEETVQILNKIYSHFDDLADRYELEKIRTIGDNYMVASGVPNPRPDHATALARMALKMIDYAEGLPSQNGYRIQFRIGINSGPLVAGVIGHKRFHYDVWGDTVNTASRMESHGMAGRIQVTQSTYELLKDEFLLEPCGMVDIKGKGELETWFLLQRID